GGRRSRGRVQDTWHIGRAIRSLVPGPHPRRPRCRVGGGLPSSGAGPRLRFERYLTATLDQHSIRSRRSSDTMAFAIVHHFPGGTKENYEASLAAVHPGPDKLPDGQILHIAGASPGGWTI